MSNFYGITDSELLDFSQNFPVTRADYLGSRIMPDVKVQYLQAEYARLVKNGNLPTSAMVHALDTEAHIASRIPFESINTEQLLIKEKINVTENVNAATRGMRMDGVKQYIFDDIARMADAVVTRAERAKMEAITSGQNVINENGATLTIDHGVPAENKVSSTWSDSADILGDISTWYDLAVSNGAAPNAIFTSRAILSVIMKNAGIQTAIFGSASTGQIPTLEQLNTLFASYFEGMTVQTNEARYAVPAIVDGKVVFNNARFFANNKFVMTALGADGTIGTGLWGVTPEEAALGNPFTAISEQQFVTVSQWDSQDPVAHWTKASGMFIPVMGNPYSHVISTITIAEG